jgi:hypothetical protein
MLGVSGLPVSFYSASIALPGSGVFNIVQLTLIGLKLASVISWPWSMVLLPVWFGLGSLFIIALGIGVAVAGERVALLVQDWRDDHTAEGRFRSRP